MVAARQGVVEAVVEDEEHIAPWHDDEGHASGAAGGPSWGERRSCSSTAPGRSQCGQRVEPGRRDRLASLPPGAVSPPQHAVERGDLILTIPDASGTYRRQSGSSPLPQSSSVPMPFSFATW